MKPVFLSIAFILAVAIFSSCSSSGPKTRYYSMFPSAVFPIETLPEGKISSLGVGPIILPEFLDNIAIVSRTHSQQVRVSGINAWAGDLKSAISRVVVGNLSNTISDGVISAFPWDNRIRPDYQVRIVFEEFSGVRGGDVQLVANWFLLDKTGSKKIADSRISLSQPTNNDTVNAYVQALNALLNKFSIQLIENITALAN